MSLPKMADDNECLGLNLRRHAEFDDGFFMYDAAQNALMMHHDQVTSELNSASCDCVAAAPSLPQGKYCGIAMGYNMKINFTDDKFLDLSFHYTGTGTQENCTHEPYTFQAWGDSQGTFGATSIVVCMTLRGHHALALRWRHPCLRPQFRGSDASRHSAGPGRGGGSTRVRVLARPWADDLANCNLEFCNLYLIFNEFLDRCNVTGHYTHINKCIILNPSNVAGHYNPLPPPPTTTSLPVVAHVKALGPSWPWLPPLPHTVAPLPRIIDHLLPLSWPQVLHDVGLPPAPTPGPMTLP